MDVATLGTPPRATSSCPSIKHMPCHTQQPAFSITYNCSLRKGASIFSRSWQFLPRSPENATFEAQNRLLSTLWHSQFCTLSVLRVGCDLRHGCYKVLGFLGSDLRNLK